MQQGHGGKPRKQHRGIQINLFIFVSLVLKPEKPLLTMLAYMLESFILTSVNVKKITPVKN